MRQQYKRMMRKQNIIMQPRLYNNDDEEVYRDDDEEVYSIDENDEKR